MTTKTKSWKPEVQTDSTGAWYGNALRFATKKEAEENAHDLMMRWFAVRETRATESDDPVNYTYHDRQLRAVDQPEGIMVRAMRSNEVDPDQKEMPLDDK